MNIKLFIKKFFSSRKTESNSSMDSSELYRLIYNTEPSSADLEYLARLPKPDKSNVVSLFRSIVNGFDHQRVRTPFTVRFSENDIYYVSVSDTQIAIDQSDLAVGASLKAGNYEPHLIEFYRERLMPGMTFLDIGANIGIYSVIGASLVGPSGRVLSFEPNTENCRLILLSMHQNGFHNYTVYPTALGDKTGYVLFTTHIGSNGGLIANTQQSLLNPSCVVVPMMRLDEVLHEKVDFIKIDVEGAEGLVMQGAINLIEKYRPVITTEFSLEMLSRVSRMRGLDYLHFFTNLGYRIYIIDRNQNKTIPISDIETFVREYGDVTRIEDLAITPG